MWFNLTSADITYSILRRQFGYILLLLYLGTQPSGTIFITTHLKLQFAKVELYLN